MQAVGEIAKSYLGTTELEPSIIESIFNVSKGNPFVLTEYLKNLLECGAISRKNSTWVLNKEIYGKTKLSSNVSELILRRIERLTSLTKCVLEYAAVLESHFSIHLLSQILTFSKKEIKDSMIQAIGSSIVENVSGDEFAFVHDRLREALYEGLDEERRRKIHTKIGLFLDKGSFSSLDDLAQCLYHYKNGKWMETPFRVYQLAVDAGVQAMESRIHEYSHKQLQFALSLINEKWVEESFGIEQWHSLALTYIYRNDEEEAEKCIKKAFLLSTSAEDRAACESLRVSNLLAAGKAGQSV